MDSTKADVSSMQWIPADQPFKSKLHEAPDRFLAHAIEHSLKHGRRTAKDFIRHFPPTTIMAGLEDEPQLRANILVSATGVRMKVALKKSASSCESDLQIALDEHETDAETVVSLFSPDDRVRFLASRALWNFLIEGDFWLIDAKKDAKGHALAAAHIAYLIERALEDQLLTHRDVVKGITVQTMANLLPRSEFPKIVDAALEQGQANKPFTDKNLLDGIGISTLTAHIPLVAFWTQVVVPYIAEPHGFARAAEAQQQERAPVVVAPPAAKPQEPSLSPPVAKAPAASPPARPSHVGLSPTRPAAVTAPPAKTSTPDENLDLTVDELLGSLTAGGNGLANKPARRPGSVPPTA